jgi:anti-anti-sigma factor
MIAISALSDGILVVLHGDVHAAALDHVLADVAADAAASHVVIDLRDARSIDRDRLAAISSASERVTRRRGRLVLCSPHPAVRRALQRRGLQTQAS